MWVMDVLWIIAIGDGDDPSAVTLRGGRRCLTGKIAAPPTTERATSNRHIHPTAAKKGRHQRERFERQEAPASA
jgi:hypothetical protein